MSRLLPPSTPHLGIQSFPAKWLMGFPSKVALNIAVLLFHFVDGALVNITVDDTNPDPLTGHIFTYSPDGSWNQGNNCTPCFRKLDPSLTSDGTWHDTTYDSSQAGLSEVQTALFKFTGSAIYVYGIETPSSSANITFYIDGQHAGQTLYGNSQLSQDTYNSLLYANASISPGRHTFEIKNGGGGGLTSQLLFDYIMYTRETDNSTTATSPNSTPGIAPTGQNPPASVTPSSSSDNTQRSDVRTIVIASVVPSVALLVAAVAFLLWRLHTKHQRLDEKQGPLAAQDARATDITLERGDQETQGLLSSTTNISSRHEQQAVADGPSAITPYRVTSPVAGTSSVERSKTSRSNNTSPPAYNALSPTE